MRYGDVKIVEECVKYSGFFEMKEYRLKHALFAGGVSPEIKRELFKRGHAVAVLPYDPERDQLILVEQFRIGALEDEQGPWLIEIVAGIIEPGEQPQEVALREAVEEAGCNIEALLPVCRCYVSPGGTDETIQLYCGRVSTEGIGGIHGLADEGEDIKVSVVSFAEAMEWLKEGRINSAIPIIALQWLALNRDHLREMWRI